MFETSQTNEGGRRLLAPAKVNLYLEVLGKRHNGYHELRTLVMPISLFDVVELSPTDGLIETVVLESSTVGLDDGFRLNPNTNLTNRAAVLLKGATGYSGGVRIRLEKHIPIGGGLGGGSSDAATVLVGLNELWGTGLSVDRLSELASQLGSDIPAFVQGGVVWVEGIGERVSRPDFGVSGAGSNGRFWLVLANPGFQVLTGDIYRRHKLALTERPGDYKGMVLACGTGDVQGVADHVCNDLQKTVLAKFPVIGSMLRRLEAAGALKALLSGSGGTVFGIARDEEDARRIEREFVRLLGCPVWTKPVCTLPDGVIGSTRPFGGLSLGSSPGRATS